MTRRAAIEATAHHEAGHAVAALRLGVPFRFVTIRPGEDYLGHLLHRKMSARFRPDIDVSARQALRLE